MLGLRTTIYKVSDIQKAAEWYSNAFETIPYYNEPYYVGFNIKGYELGLQPEDNPTFDKVESVVSYWGVENIQATFDRLIELGATENPCTIIRCIKALGLSQRVSPIDTTK
ncbi:MAG: hypothetical protein RIR11_1630 [Bacteroidota bacterium]|jgi:lactoylglutathione lyase